jgi:hypothetical protein
MPAPKRPNTAAATEAVRRRGQETMAAKLREAGWVVITPEKFATVRDCPFCTDPEHNDTCTCTYACGTPYCHWTDNP